MLFSIVGTDHPNSLEKRQQVRQQHLARLHELSNENRLVLAGPNPNTDDTPGFTGSIIIAEFESLEAAQTWANADPYIAAEVYAQVDIKPFKQVLPAVTA